MVKRYVFLDCMRMKLFEKFLVLLICLVQVQESVCSHFRGATFTYRPVDPSDAANLKVNSQDKSVFTVSTEITEIIISVASR